MTFARRTVIALAIGTALTAASFSWIQRPLGKMTNGNNLQGINDPAKVCEAIAAWQNHPGGDLTRYAFAGVAVDTVLFIPLYSLMLFGGISRLPNFLRWLAPLGLLAGAADLAENLGILVEIAGNPAVAPATFVFSKVKWALIYAAGAVWVVGALAAFFNSRRMRRE